MLCRTCLLREERLDEGGKSDLLTHDTSSKQHQISNYTCPNGDRPTTFVIPLAMYAKNCISFEPKGFSGEAFARPTNLDTLTKAYRLSVRDLQFGFGEQWAHNLPAPATYQFLESCIAIWNSAITASRISRSRLKLIQTPKPMQEKLEID